MKTILLDKIGSTNTYAKSLNNYDDEIVIVRAIRQTEGRGRMGRAYFSDHDGGLWVSIITPVEDIAKHFIHNRAVCLSILRYLKCIDGGATVKIKWPNDIYWGDRKIAGVLLENMPGRAGTLIIGFGINVNIAAKDIPEDLRDTATSVLIETGTETSLDKMLDGIMKKYFMYRDDDQAGVHQLYCDNLYGIGRSASVGRHKGILAGAEMDGRLRLDTDHGMELPLSGTLRFADEDHG